RHLFEDSPYFVGLVDLKGNLIDCNNQAEHFLSVHKKEDIIGKDFRDIFSINKNNKYIIPTLEEIFGKLLKGEIIDPVVFKLYRTIGRFLWLNLRLSLIDIEGNKVIQFIVQDVTEKKEAEQKLKESEEKYKNLVENAQEGVWAVDENNNTIFVNLKLCEMLGYTKNDMMGSNLNLYLDDSMMELIDRYRPRREKGLKDTYDLEFIRKDGTLIQTSINAAPILNENGKFKGSFAYINDITNRKIAEQKLKESEKRYRNLFESMPYVIVLINQKGIITDCNLGIKKLLGYDKKEIVGKEFGNLQIIHPKYLPIILKRFKRLMKGEELHPIEIQIYKKDGNLIWINYQSTLVDTGDELLLQAIVNDISEQKKAEQELVESEEKFRTIFEAIPDIYFLVDHDTTILDYKGKEEDLYLPPELFLGKKLTDVMPVEIQELSLNAVKNTIKTKQPQLMEYALPIKNETRYFEARHLFFSEERVAIFIREITDRKKADLLIKEEVIKLKELDQIRKDLISRVSHELKTPLVSVVGGSELFLNNFKENMKDEELELIEIIQKGGKRLKHLIENLLDITRIEYSKFKLEKEEDDLCEIVKEISFEMKHLINERKLILNIEQPESLCIYIDRIRIEQVITNLLLNAIKNTPPMGIISLKLQKNEEWAEISVSDTGVGITKEEMNIIFTRFGKIERYGEGLEYIDIQGSGLGLFISKEIVDLHGGYIRAESEGRNKGSTFIVKLPIHNRFK
ncbi:MAG: PAS domain S-box protein, partial [Candidatus Hermodarchaeota archaeon]